MIEVSGPDLQKIAEMSEMAKDWSKGGSWAKLIEYISSKSKVVIHTFHKLELKN